MDLNMQVLDVAALRDHLKPGGPWAIEAGLRVARRRRELGLNEEQAAVAVGCSGNAIRAIEAGKIVPRNYLQHAVAYLLTREVSDLWPAVSLSRIGEIASAA
jgi:DNA-binding XRE family transcriptional regulator